MRYNPVVLMLLVFSSLTVSITSSQGQDHIIYQLQVISANDDHFDYHVEPAMAIGDDNSIYVGWKNADTHDGGGKRVSYTYSSDGGDSWQNPKLMDYFDPRGTGQSDPWMQVYNNTLFYSYLEFNVDLSQITISKTTDKGTTWTLVNASNALGFADKETFVIDSQGRIFLVYNDITAEKSTVRVSRSLDGGNSYIDNIILNDLDGPYYHGPYITSGEVDQLFVAWSFITQDPRQSDIYLDRSFDAGLTWMMDADINPLYNASTFTINPASQRPMKVSLPVLEYDANIGRLYVMWDDISSDIYSMDWDVYMKYTDNAGLTWSQRHKINIESSNDQWMPDFEIDSQGNLHVIYYTANDLGNYDLEYAIWNQSTSLISYRNTVSQTSTSSEFTRPGEYNVLKLDGDDVPHVVWTGEYQNKLDIFYAKLVPYNRPTISTTSTVTTNSSPISHTSSTTTKLPIYLGPMVLSSIAIIVLISRAEVKNQVKIALFHN